MNSYKLQPLRRQKAPPVVFTSLLRGMNRHHGEVDRRKMRTATHCRQDVLIQKELAVPSLHSRDNVAQDPLCIIVWPVVQNRSQEINASAMYRLRVEEVVILKFHVLRFISL